MTHPRATRNGALAILKSAEVPGSPDCRPLVEDAVALGPVGKDLEEVADRAEGDELEDEGARVAEEAVVYERRDAEAVTHL